MVFFHLLDDEILELYNAKKKFSRERILARLTEELYLLLAILPADEVVVLSPTFLFENEICEKILMDNRELLMYGYITVFMKEPNLEEFHLKKQERYIRVEKHAKYRDAYYRNYKKRLKLLAGLPLLSEYKTVSVGSASFAICEEMLKKERDACQIPERIFDDIFSRLRESEASSFLWESVAEQLTKANVSDRLIRDLNIREIMTRSYVEAYQTEEIVLVQDKMIYPDMRQADKNAKYDLIKIDRLLSALGIKSSLLMMSCGDFCKLKENGDYILEIKKVHDKFQSGMSIEEILQSLRESKTDQKLQDILKNRGEEKMNIPDVRADVMIMIAAPDEERAITGRGEWERKRIASGQEYFMTVEKGIIFALVRGYREGESDAAIMAQKFVEALNPRVIAMAGFCAGKEGDVHLGDVIVADKVYNYDLGKQVSANEVLPEISNYSLNGDWLQFIERLDGGWLDTLNMQPPVDFQWQIIEFMRTLRKEGRKKKEELYSKEIYPDWKQVVDHLLHEQWITIGGDAALELTEEGTAYIDRYMIRHIKNVPPRQKLRVGTIATGTKVQQWDEIFQRLETRDRKTCALDMESHVIGKLGSFNRIPFLVVKGVGDFARNGKKFANRFIEFTSYASCRFIMDLFSMEDFRDYWMR